MLLQSQWIYDEIIEEIKKYLEANGNENTAIKNLLGSAKAVHISIQKTNIMASGSITSWQIDVETMETVTDYFPGLQNHCR